MVHLIFFIVNSDIFRNTSRSDFKFFADRLIRLVIEDSLNQLPFTDCKVVTPTGATYEGLKYKSGNCGVSIVRSGESMEQGLRDCCRSIRIGKILVESDADTHEARVVYARFPEDIAQRHVSSGLKETHLFKFCPDGTSNFNINTQVQFCFTVNVYIWK